MVAAKSIVSTSLSLLGVALGGSANTNMNGEYLVASKDAIVPFNTDYASKGHEYFDVWAPEIATHYGEGGRRPFAHHAARSSHPPPPRPRRTFGPTRATCRCPTRS